MKILAHFNPCGFFICYSVLYVIRAEENVEDSTQRTALQVPTLEVPDKHVAEEDLQSLRSAMWWNGTVCEKDILYYYNDDNFSHQITRRYVELPLPHVIKGEWYYPNRNELVFSFFLGGGGPF
jgi:glucan-binding YG repeat protein